MQLLGAYQSNLTAFQLEALLSLLQSGLQAGDFGGGRLFDKAASDALLAQGQDFTSIPQISAGSRALADSINHPLQILTARYQAIAKEKESFLSRINSFLAVLNKEAVVIDRLLYAAKLENWITQQPPISGSEKFYLDFGASHGTIATSIDFVDPATGHIYLDASGNVREVSNASFIVNGVGLHGICAPVDHIDSIAPVNLKWTVLDPPAGTGESTILDGTDWASLSYFSPQPIINFLTPSARVMLPASRSGQQVIQLKGNPVTGNLPVYLRLVFTPRRSVTTLQGLVHGKAVSLSANRVSTDALIVSDANRTYEIDQDYQIDLTNGKRDLIPLASLAGLDVTVLFTEYFPGYQCSINNLDWSPVVLFDPENPFPDVTQNYFPISIVDGWYPVVDELGRALGTSFQPLSNPTTEYLLRIENQISASYGVTSQLEVDFEYPAYMNGFHLEPFSGLPMRLLRIEGEGLVTGSTISLFEGDVPIDQARSIRFTNSDGSLPYLSRITLTIYQENYLLVEQISETPDQLRQDSLVRLQSIVPFASQIVTPSLPKKISGAQYDFGLRNLSGERWYPAGPGVHISGPFEVTGSPEVIRFDVQDIGSNRYYLMYQLFDTAGVAQGLVSSTDVITSGSVFSFPDLVAPSFTVGKVQFYLKSVLLQDMSVLTRYLLQISTKE